MVDCRNGLDIDIWYHRLKRSVNYRIGVPSDAGTVSAPATPEEPERNPEEPGEVIHYAENKDYRNHRTLLA